jgi:hypothetical protein
MFKNKLGRGTAVVGAAIFCALLMGLGTSASASALVYSASNVSVKVSGGDALALNNCINDAQDGFIQTQQNSCNQVATSGNIVQLDDSSIWVFSSSCYCTLPLFSASHVTVEVTGGVATAINNCLNDARDGVIQTQLNACTQYSVAGSIVMLSNVTVYIYQ